MTRAAKRDIDRGELARSWQRQAKGLGKQGPENTCWGCGGLGGGDPAERQSVFGHANLLAAMLAACPRGRSQRGAWTDFGPVSQTRPLPVHNTHPAGAARQDADRGDRHASSGYVGEPAGRWTTPGVVTTT